MYVVHDTSSWHHPISVGFARVMAGRQAYKKEAQLKLRADSKVGSEAIQSLLYRSPSIESSKKEICKS
jgi:hypothetical protein